MISRDFFSVANNLGDSVAFNLESDNTRPVESKLRPARVTASTILSATVKERDAGRSLLFARGLLLGN
jgi:hypothetical protein